MRIKSIELEGFKRFALGLFQKLTYTPEHKIQLILGTNGGGKSSLMKELSPLPALPADFKPGGSKKVIIEHANKEFILVSSFHNGAKHSFSIDGQEFNDGGTASVQRELVNQYFGITPEVHELLTGQLNFSNMSVATRREWFTKLSNINFDFALSFYNQLKNQQRDTEGALKFQKSLLLTESAKLLKPEELNVYKNELRSYQQVVDLLISYKTNHNSSDTSDLSEVIERSLNALKSTMGVFKNFSVSYNPHLLPSHISNLEVLLGVTENKYADLLKLLESQQSIQNQINKISQEELADIDNQIQLIQQEYFKTSDKLKYLTPNTDPSVVSSAVHMAYDALHDVFLELPIASTGNYSREGYEGLKTLLQQLKQSLEIAESNYKKIDAQIAQLEHFKIHNETTCPNCKHVWSQGYDPSLYQKLLTARQSLNEEINKLKTEIEKSEKGILSITDYFDKIKSYMRIKDSMPVLTRIWDIITEEGLIRKDPQSVIRLLEHAKYEIPLLTQLSEYQQKLKDLKQISKLRSDNQQLNIVNIDKTIKQLESELTDIQITKRSIVQELRTCKEQLRVYEQIKTYASNLENLLEQQSNHADNSIKSYRNVMLSELIKQAQMVISHNQMLIHNVDKQQNLVDSINKQIEILTDKHTVLTAMVNEMSPKDGLIAKSISSFINSFITKINKIIKQIWMYPLELELIDMSEQDINLDYRFPVIAGNGLSVPDIGKCSSGMREIIDLSFRIVSMGYMGMHDYPVYMDEFGKSMDSAHRSKAFDVITKMIAQSNYSQVFIVSHHEHSYGSLKNADICVLNPDNVVIPTGAITNRIFEFS